MSIPVDTKRLAFYANKLSKLKQGGTAYGKAPHKPIFLLTLFELIEKQFITENKVCVTPELVATFKENLPYW
jgi:putative restriction endonuclease